MSDLPPQAATSTPLDGIGPSNTPTTDLAPTDAQPSAPSPPPLPPPPPPPSSSSLPSQKRPLPEQGPTTTSVTASRAKRPRANVKYRNGKGPSRRMATAGAANSSRLSSGIEMTNVSSDFCAACGAAGLYVCCDGCPRVFHPFCLEPPLSGVEEAGEHWYCRECDASRGRHPPIPSTSSGLFSPLIQQQHNENPKAFKLPEGLRNRYEHVATNPHTGDFVDQSCIKSKKKLDGVKGYADEPTPYQIKTRDGRTILCYQCGLGASAAKKLKILGCDECDQYFHLDCLDPPLVALPSTSVKWVCPLHSEKAVPARRVPKESVTVTITKPNTPNDGDIDVILASQKRIKAKKVEEISINRVRYQVPENIIILDFWSKLGKTDHAQLLTSRTRESSPLTSLSSNLGSPRAPILGQDILPPSAATSEDASSLVTSPGRKTNNSLLAPNGLGCSIYGDASQPTSRASSPEPLQSAARGVVRPDLSCLLQAASETSKAPKAFDKSGLDLLGDAVSVELSTSIEQPEVKRKPPASRRTLAVGLRRSSPPRTRRRGSGRVEETSTRSSPTSSTTPGPLTSTKLLTSQVSEKEGAIDTTTSSSIAVSNGNPLTGVENAGLESIKTQEASIPFPQSNMSCHSVLTPTASGSNSPSLTKIPNATRRVRKSSNLASKKKATSVKDPMPSGLTLSMPLDVSPETIEPANMSQMPVKEPTPNPDTDGEGSSQLSKGPTRIRIKGTKYLERLAQDFSDQQAGSGLPSFSQFSKQSSMSGNSEVHANPSANGIFASEQQPIATSQKLTPSEKVPGKRLESSKKPSKVSAPRARTAKRPSSALEMSPVTPVSRATNIKPSALDTRLGPGPSPQTVTGPSKSVPARKRTKKTPAAPIVDSAGIGPPSEPAQTGSRASTAQHVPPRKKPRANNYSADGGDPAGPSQTKCIPNKRLESDPLAGSMSIGSSAPLAISRLSPATSPITPQGPNAHLSILNPTQTGSSTDTPGIPKKGRVTNSKKKVVSSAPLTSSSLSVESPAVPKTVQKAPERNNATGHGSVAQRPRASLLPETRRLPTQASVKFTPQPAHDLIDPKRTVAAGPAQVPTSPSASPSTSYQPRDNPLPKAVPSLPRKCGTGAVKSTASPRLSLPNSHLSPEALVVESPLSQQMSPVVRTLKATDPSPPSASQSTSADASRPKDSRSATKTVKARVRKRVVSAPDPNPDQAVGESSAPGKTQAAATGGPPEETRLEKIGPSETLGPAPSSLPPNVGAGATAPTAPKPSLSTAKPTDSAAVRKKKKTSKAKPDPPPPSAPPSVIPSSSMIPIPNFSASLPFVPHPQNNTLPFVPHPQQQHLYVGHPQHGPFVHPPIGYVAHPQYPLAVLKAVPTQVTSQVHKPSQENALQPIAGSIQAPPQPIASTSISQILNGHHPPEPSSTQ
ncbi:hypothetical protein CROQUDRAFT_358638 [Cronartium quercuum f. sp. fusiforme G11]|uniref:PHD-type domain-containing protein n=1 Tax=Cronartium quercuum f. sp. fusiforme G11 TaxID=708437 RepID=A0A9P6T646_9BASI|nr:hypothetical protein CROQUDRAFT_358638 [Cronartium quercuum f. sp. fusiforme G11]